MNYLFLLERDMIKEALFVFSLCALGTSFGLPGTAYADKELFLKLKCNHCHSLSALGIEKKAGSGDDEESEDADDAPDQSHVGKFHDAAFIKDFLTKKVDHTPHEGCDKTGKHKFKFKGTDEDLEKMAGWLAGMK